MSTAEYQRQWNLTHPGYAAKIRKKTNANRLARGECGRCGHPRKGRPCVPCKDESAKRNSQRKAEGKCFRCSNPSREGKTLCPSCMEAQMIRNAQVRQDVLDGYGARCVCCGETEEGFLTLDHVQGRKRGQPSGLQAYWEAKKGGYPPTFQILCYNCNMGREHQQSRVCPHQQKPIVKHNGFKSV